MSTKRELDEAKNELVTAALRWFDALGYDIIPPGNAVDSELSNAVRKIKPLLVDLDGDAAANATYTSIVAAKTLPAKGGLRRMVLSKVYWMERDGLPGLTTDTLEYRLRREHTSVSSAVNYLVNHGLLEKAGVRQKTRQGRLAEVYRCTDLARRLITEDAARAKEG